MAFEWQDKADAAETLGVDLATLDRWIETGQAPTRAVGDRVQVLIEFPEDDAPEDTDQPADEPVDPAPPTPPPTAEGEVIDAESEPAADDEPRVARRVELVPARELQMATGMVAAWQRLAEQSDRELARARRLGTWGWTAAGVLVLATIVLLVIVGDRLGGKRVDEAVAVERLRGAEGRAAERQQELADLRAEASALADELAAERLARATAEARSASLQAAQARLDAALADGRGDRAAVIAALREVAEERRREIDRLRTAATQPAEPEPAAATTQPATQPPTQPPTRPTTQPDE